MLRRLLTTVLKSSESLTLNSSGITHCDKCKLYTSVKSFKSYKTPTEEQRTKIRSTLYYVSAAGVLVAGLSYAAVPLYRMFCQSYSYGGTTVVGHDADKVETMSAVKHRPVKVKFNADIGSSMRWNFKPQQNEISVSLRPFVISILIPFSILSHILNSSPHFQFIRSFQEKPP